MNQQSVLEALGLERKRNEALLEARELTDELAQALQRQDQVSVQMFLSMRQEPINRLREFQALRRKQLAALPEGELGGMKQLLSGSAPGQTAAEQSLVRLAGQNRHLLEQVLQEDRRLSTRLGGRKSYYARQEKNQ